jgi:hypothetical protein
MCQKRICFKNGVLGLTTLRVICFFQDSALGFAIRTALMISLLAFDTFFHDDFLINNPTCDKYMHFSALSNYHLRLLVFFKKTTQKLNIRRNTV